MAKNPFKTKNITDALINVGIGGAANVGVDYICTRYLSTTEQDTIDLVKGIGGAVGSTMVGNRFIKAAFDGIAVAGFSSYIRSQMADSFAEAAAEAAAEKAAEGTSGVPYGTVGRVRYIAPRAAKARAFANKNISGVPNGTISEMMN